MRVNKAELAVKIETTPGTYEALAQADVKVRIRAPDTPAFDVGQFDPEELQAVSSKRPTLTTRRQATFDHSYLFRGPGDLVTAPAISPHLRSMMLKEDAANILTIGAITSGPYVVGETVTGGTSGATATVIRQTVNGETELGIVDVASGPFQAETITGGTSGASSTSTGAETSGGYLYRYSDSDFAGGDTTHHISARWLQDGFYWDLRGGLSNALMRFRNGEPAIVEQSLIGAFHDHEDAALFGVTTYPEESIAAPRFLNANITMGTYKPTDIVEFALTLGNGIFLREDANDTAAQGILFSDYNREAPEITFDPAHVLKATRDFFGDLINGTSFAMQWELLGAQGSNWTFAAPDAQVTSVQRGSRETLATAPITVRLNGSNNDEIYIWQH